MPATPAARLARPRRWPGVVAWTLWALAMVACLVIPWLDRLLRQAGRPDLEQWDLRPGVALVTAATVGAVLGGGYAAVVLGLGQLLGRDSSLVVAAATLAVAAVFQPARRRIQQAVDRRFNRRRHDAAETIQAFSDRLRGQVDLDTLSAELLAVVEETMQPNQASLWLRRQASSTAAGRP
jgi:hypothetical protein